jgi:hypothetical protein
MVGGLADTLDGSIQPTPRGDVDLAAEYRLDPGTIHLLVEINGAEHVPVIGHGHGRHTEFQDPITQGPDPYRPIQQAVFSVQV